MVRQRNDFEIYPPGVFFFFFVANFRHLATNKRANESNKGIFEDLKKKNRHISKKKRG
jgi:hypothetical protein